MRLYGWGLGLTTLRCEFRYSSPHGMAHGRDDIANVCLTAHGAETNTSNQGLWDASKTALWLKGARPYTEFEGFRVEVFSLVLSKEWGNGSLW